MMNNNDLMGSKDFYNSSKIIEFFWFFPSFLLFLFAFFIKFIAKSDIHMNAQDISINKYK